MVWFQCVERLDLAGMDFIWRIAMETPDEEIANEAIQLIITYSYTNLNPKMKKVSMCSRVYVQYVCVYCKPACPLSVTSNTHSDCLQITTISPHERIQLRAFSKNFLGSQTTSAN